MPIASSNFLRSLSFLWIIIYFHPLRSCLKYVCLCVLCSSYLSISPISLFCTFTPLFVCHFITTSHHTSCNILLYNVNKNTCNTRRPEKRLPCLLLLTEQRHINSRAYYAAVSRNSDYHIRQKSPIRLLIRLFQYLASNSDTKHKITKPKHTFIVLYEARRIIKRTLLRRITSA